MQRIGPEVHQRAAALLPRPAQFAGIPGDRDIEARRGVRDATQTPLAHHSFGLADHPVEAVMEGLQQRAPGTRSGLDHGARVRGVAGEGLLAQHRFARFQRRDGPSRVTGRRQAVVDDVHVVAAHELGIVRGGRRDSVRLRIGLRALRVARGHRRDHEAAVRARWLDHGRWGDAGGPEEADADGIVHAASSTAAGREAEASAGPGQGQPEHTLAEGADLGGFIVTEGEGVAVKYRIAM